MLMQSEIECTAGAGSEAHRPTGKRRKKEQHVVAYGHGACKHLQQVVLWQHVDGPGADRCGLHKLLQILQLVAVPLACFLHEKPHPGSISNRKTVKNKNQAGNDMTHTMGLVLAPSAPAPAPVKQDFAISTASRPLVTCYWKPAPPWCDGSSA